MTLLRDKSLNRSKWHTNSNAKLNHMFSLVGSQAGFEEFGRLPREIRCGESIVSLRG
jgi:hypothetical protein